MATIGNEETEVCKQSKAILFLSRPDIHNPNIDLSSSNWSSSHLSFELASGLGVDRFIAVNDRWQNYILWPRLHDTCIPTPTTEIASFCTYSKLVLVLLGLLLLMPASTCVQDRRLDPLFNYRRIRPRLNHNLNTHHARTALQIRAPRLHHGVVLCSHNIHKRRRI